MRVPGSFVAIVALSSTGAGCNRSRHERIASYTPPALSAGFAQRTGAGWRVAVPSTWRDLAQRGPAAWAVADPQPVDDFRANVNVLTESFVGESYDYAKANEAALRREARAAVDAIRDDVIDGDPTLLIESSWTPQPPSTTPFRTMQAALASRGAGYVVTCSVASVAFERYRSTCESIMRSFAVER
ncbi:MAG: hypothetical protein M3O46_22420 [Myxococcota bacterium]|nr:hypothetical protein [Myxococcota bacterium]